MVVFLLMRVIPGDPTITKLGGSIKEVDQATLDGIRAELGLDKSIPAAVRRLGRRDPAR